MISYLIIDIDGTLTDGSIYYDGTDNEYKKFCAKDGTGINLIIESGIKPLVLTGRESIVTSRRMIELGVTEVNQGVKDKALWIDTWMKDNMIDRSIVGYIGDDFNDLRAMKLCGFVACPADAIEEVKEIADYVATVNGGHGVLRDVIKHLLIKENRWEEVLNNTYGVSI